MTMYLLDEGQAGGNGEDEIISENNEPIDLTNNVVTVDETIENIGGQNVTLSQEVEFRSTTGGDVVTLINTALPSATVEIPNQSVVSAPATWNKQITPPKTVSTPSIEIAGFNTPTTAIEVGSPDVILVFDRAVTIILTGTTGQTAYKLPGGTEWILISTCSGTFESPNDPPVNGECSISNDTDTKIVTFHFTEFTGLTTPTSTPTPTAPSTGNSGGHGNTGVGSPRIFGPSSSGSSGGGTYYGPSDSGPRIFPAWFDNVKDWYRMGDISATEFLNAYQWIMTNIIK